MTTIQNSLRGLGHKRGVLSCTVTSPDLSPEASGSLPSHQPHIPKLPTFSHTFRHFFAPSDVFRNLPTLTYFLCKDKSKFHSIVTFFFILQRGGPFRLTLPNPLPTPLPIPLPTLLLNSPLTHPPCTICCHHQLLQQEVLQLRCPGKAGSIRRRLPQPQLNPP